MKFDADCQKVHGIMAEDVEDAPTFQDIFEEIRSRLEGQVVFAHNARFDYAFLKAEFARLGIEFRPQMLCTVKLSRRLYPQAPNHQLGTLVDFHRLPRTGQAHRALADAEMAAALLCRIQQDLRGPSGTGRADHDWLMQVQACPKAKIGRLLASA